MRKDLIPNFSCLLSGLTVTGEDEILQAINDGYQQIYIQTSEGIFKHHTLRPGKDGANRFIRLPIKEVPGLPLRKLEKHVQFFPDGKVPMELFDEVKFFFKEIMKKKATAVEAMIWVLWNEEKGYYLHVPKQVVSRASAQYDWSCLPDDSIIVVDIHSHADFGAFFSSTDDKDDVNSVRFSVVVGHNNTDKPSIKARFNYLSERFDVEIDQIFTYKNKPEIEIPEEWLDNVKTHSQVAIGSYQGNVNSPRGNGVGNSGVTNNVSYPFGQAVGLDGRPRTYTGPSYSGTRVVKGAASDDDAQGSLGLESDEEGKKKHFGGHPTTSATSESTDEKGFASLITNPKVKYLHGRTWLDTGDGLIELKDTDDMLKAALSTGSGSKVNALEKAFEDTPEVEQVESFSERLTVAARRQAQEDLLQEQHDEWMSRLEKEASKDSAAVDDLLKNVGMTTEDLPSNYDLLVCNHGEAVANAYAVITHMSTDLVSSDEILDLCIEEFFSLKDSEGMLATFRTLYQLLPESAKEKIAHGGM